MGLRAQIELLNWVLKLLASGMPYGMVSAIVRKRVREIEKEADSLLPLPEHMESPHIF